MSKNLNHRNIKQLVIAVLKKKNKTTDCYIWNDEISILVTFTHILLTTLTLQDSQQLIYILFYIV